MAIFPYGILYAKIKVINIVLLVIFILIWRLIFQFLGLYDSTRLEKGKAEGKTLLLAILIGTMVLLAMTVFFQRPRISQATLLAFMVLAGILTWGGRTALRIILGKIRQWNRNVCRLLLVGSNHRAYNFVRCVLATPQLGYHIVGYIDDHWDDSNGGKLEGMLKQLGTLQELDVVIDREEIDEVVIALPIRSYYEQIQRMIAACEIRSRPISCRISSSAPLPGRVCSSSMAFPYWPSQQAQCGVGHVSEACL